MKRITISARKILLASLTAAMMFASASVFAMTNEQVNQFWDTYYVEKDYAAAKKIVLPLVKKGDADAQYDLGIMYAEGNGFKQDYHQAIKWFKKAANKGQIGAQKTLAEMYENGEGVAQDFKQARYWYGKAAAQEPDEAKAALQRLDKEGK